MAWNHFSQPILEFRLWRQELYNFWILDCSNIYILPIYLCLCVCVCISYCCCYYYYTNKKVFILWANEERVKWDSFDALHCSWELWECCMLLKRHSRYFVLRECLQIFSFIWLFLFTRSQFQLFYLALITQSKQYLLLQVTEVEAKIVKMRNV